MPFLWTIHRTGHRPDYRGTRTPIIRHREYIPKNMHTGVFGLLLCGYIIRVLSVSMLSMVAYSIETLVIGNAIVLIMTSP